MLLRQGQTLKHSCGLTLENTSGQVIELQKDLCPQCKANLTKHDILGGADMVKWQLHPPPGMSFKNEFGSTVSITFEEGREAEVFQQLSLQLNKLVQTALAVPQQQQSEKGSIKPTPLGITIDDDGEVAIKQ